MSHSKWYSVYSCTSCKRSTEISKISEWALASSTLLGEFPNTVVDVHIMIPQADASTRCAGINAASLALAHAGIPMKDLISSVSVGKAGENLIVDLDYLEDSAKPGVDIPMAMSTRTGQITLLQMDGELTKEELKKALELGKKACMKIKEVQTKALLEKFNGGKKWATYWKSIYLQYLNKI